MTKVFHFIIILMFCGCLGACNKTKSPQNKSVADSSYLNTSQYYSHLFTSSSTKDSALAIVRNIVEDTTRWWSMPIVHTNAMNYVENFEEDSIKIAIAKNWCENHPQECNDFIWGKIWSRQSNYNILAGNWDEAINSLQKALAHYTNINAYLEQSATFINLGGSYYRSGNIPVAMDYYRQAAYLEDSLRIKEHYVMIFSGIAQAYTDLQNYAIANKFLDRASEYLDEASNIERYFYYITQGACHYYQKKYKLAYSDFNMASEYANNIGLYQMIVCKASLGEIALMDNDIELALSHIADCVTFLEEHPMMNNKTLKFYIASLSADVYMAHGDFKKAQHLFEILPDPKEVKMMRYLSLHYQRLCSYAAQYKDYKKAYELQNIADRYDDSVSNIASIQRVIEIRQRYQRDTTLLRQRYQIAYLEAKSTQHKMRLSILLGGLLIITLASIITTIVVRHRNDKRIQAQFEQISKLRMDVIRNRLSPHFVFNVLGMMLPKFKQNPELHQLSELFIDVLRGNLLASNQLSIVYTEEIRLVRQYVGLYHKSKSELPVVNWHDATNGEANNILVPTTCILIPIENALKHAFPILNEEARIDIYTMCEDNRLMIRVIDNGAGFHPGKVAATGRDTGTGLRVLSRTFALLNLKNSRPIEFSVRNLKTEGNKGTEVKISIPFEYQYKL